MPKFEDICEIIYASFKRLGSPGIEGVGDAGSWWIFAQAPEVEGEVEYGPRPIFVEKTTGDSRLMDIFDSEDWNMCRNAQPIEFPDKYKPKRK